MDRSVKQLMLRLPELEWKLGELGINITPSTLPPGLFRTVDDMTPIACINEIRSNLHALAVQENELSANYLAHKIKQKIDVLVTICKIHKKTKPKQAFNLGIKSLSTRQQWMQSIEQDINTLTIQQQALIHSLKNNHHNAPTLLTMNLEIGEIERRLTLAKETLARASTM